MFTFRRRNYARGVKDSHKGLIFFVVVLSVVALVLIAGRCSGGSDSSPPPVRYTPEAEVELLKRRVMARCELWWDGALELTDDEVETCVALILDGR